MRTKVDALAIACGTSHGAYKFTRKPDGDILAMRVIEEIHERLPNTHLVMHGSSSVPQELQDVINEYGGEMPQTCGVPVEEIERGIRHGVRKVNIDTDCRMAMTGQFRRIATENPGEFDPRKFLKPAMDAMRDLCRDRFERFGTAGNAWQDQGRRHGRDGQALRRRQARPANRNRQSRLSNRQETCHEQDGHAHDRNPQGRQGTLQVRRHPLQEDGLLGARLPSPRTPT